MSDIIPTQADIKAARAHRLKIADCICDTCMRATSEAFARHAAQARLEERAAIVEWLSVPAWPERNDPLIEAIKRGEHIALTSTGGDQK